MSVAHVSLVIVHALVEGDCPRRWCLIFSATSDVIVVTTAVTIPIAKAVAVYITAVIVVVITVCVFVAVTGVVVIAVTVVVVVASRQPPPLIRFSAALHSTSEPAALHIRAGGAPHL